MTNPIVNTNFSTGTTISSAWLNGVNDFVNGQNQTTPIPNRVVTSIAALRAISKVNYNQVFVTGYYAQGDGGGGAYYLDVSDTTSADNGGTIIVAADGGRWKLVWYGSVSALQFGAKPDAGTTDNSTVFANMRAWVAAGALKNKLRFPTGNYGYSVSPNWAINNADISFDGEVRFTYSGTGNAVIIDGGPTTGGVFNLSFGRGNKPIILGNAGSQNGVYMRSILQNCWIGARIDGAGTTYAGYRIEFAVCAVFDMVCSNNVQGGVFYSKPYYGGYVTQRGVGELTSYCLFINPILEGVASACMVMDYAQGNILLGGTLEGSASVGLSLTANAIKNKVMGTDFEANTDHDVYCLGNYNEFHGINSEFKTTFDGTAKFNKCFGGTYQDILLTNNTVNNLISGIVYNQLNTTGTINDMPNKNRRRDNNNYATSNVENVPLATTGITVTASPFTYTNTSSNEITVSVTGGTISAMTLTHGGGTTSGLPTNNMYNLSPGDSLTITYSAAPNMNQLTR